MIVQFMPVRIVSAPNVGLATLSAQAVQVRVLDFIDGGPLRVAGTVKEHGSPDMPVWRRVLLLDQRSARVVRSTWSDAVTGAYSFDNIRAGTFMVVANDHTGNENAVIKDGITPGLMP